MTFVKLGKNHLPFSKICEKLRVLRRRQGQKNPLRARARLVNHLRRHVSQSVNLFFYLPIVSRGILAGEFFPYSEVFIWVIGSVPNVLRVEERDQAGFPNNADLFDNKTDTEITDCLTRFKVLCLLIVDIFHCTPYQTFPLLTTPMMAKGEKIDVVPIIP